MQNVASTVISQYADSPVINALINTMNAAIDPAANIDDFYTKMWNVQTAQGYGLDVIGRIVGVTRVITISGGTYFGFTGPTGTPSPGYSGQGFNQAPFYFDQPTTSNYALSDAAFRTLIYAKMLVNIGNQSVPYINNILMTLFGTAQFMGQFSTNSLYVTSVQSGFVNIGAHVVATYGSNTDTFTITGQTNGSPNGIGLYTTSGGGSHPSATTASCVATCPCYVIDGENMTMEYYFAFTPSPVQLSIINNSGVLPRPSGTATTVVHT
jgi:hypothetical protein